MPISIIKSDGKTKQKMPSRQREDFKARLALFEEYTKADSANRLSVKSEAEDAVEMELNKIDEMDPTLQWGAQAVLEEQMLANGLTPEVEAEIRQQMNSAPPPSVEDGKVVKEEPSGSAAGKRNVAGETAAEQESREAIETRKQVEATVMATHAEKMRTDPAYKAQFEIVMQNSLAEQYKKEANKAFEANKDAFKSTAAGTPSESELPPKTTEADYTSVSKDSEDSENSWTATQAGTHARRAQAASAAAIEIAIEARNACWICILLFLPRKWKPQWLSEEVRRWRAKGWLSREIGVAGVHARGTPCRVFVEDDWATWGIQDAINWCSGGQVRSVVDIPSEISQQNNQYRDALSFFRTQVKKLGLVDKYHEVLCKPKRRPKRTLDALAEADATLGGESGHVDDGSRNDWWSIGMWSTQHDKLPLMVLLRCEYDHTRQKQRFKSNVAALMELRIPRSQLLDHLIDAHTFYEFSLDVRTEAEAKIEMVREPTLSEVKEEELEKDEPSAAEAASADAWAEYLTAKNGGKGSKKGQKKSDGKKGKTKGCKKGDGKSKSSSSKGYSKGGFGSKSGWKAWNDWGKSNRWS